MKKMLFCVMVVLAASCALNKSDAAFKEALTAANSVLDELETAVTDYGYNPNLSNINKVRELASSKNLICDPDLLDIDDNQKAILRQRRKLLDSLNRIVGNLTEEFVHNNYKILCSEERLVEDIHVVPMYLKRGTSVILNCNVDGPATIKFYNADSRALLKTYGKQDFRDSLYIQNSAIYLLEVTAKSPRYCNLEILQVVKDFDEFNASYKINAEQMETTADAFRAHKVPGVEIVPIFEEPHKYTLRSRMKYIMDMTNSNRSIAALKLPAGTTDVLYRLRISTADNGSSSDGQFFDDVYTKYKQVKFLGLPLYESTNNRNGLLRELLSGVSVQREENAYCNLYVFAKSTTAKAFMDRIEINRLSYDVDNSLLGTQSISERIHTKGASTIYLGFENTRVRYDVYLWLEVLATVKKDVYYTEKYTLAN